MPNSQQSPPTARALTLLETMIAIAVIAVLLALLLPNIRGVRKQSEDAVNLSNLRQTMTDFAAWSNDHDGVMVNAGLPDDHAAHWFYGAASGAPLARSLYRSQMQVWPRILYRWSGENSEAWHAPNGPSTLNGDLDLKSLPAFGDRSQWHDLPSRYIYSETMLTSSAVWQQWDQAQSTDEFALAYKQIRFDEIIAPANKGVLILREDQIEPIVWPTAFADGHVESRRSADFRDPVSHPTSRTRAPGKPVLHTLQGSAGFDL